MRCPFLVLDQRHQEKVWRAGGNHIPCNIQWDSGQRLTRGDGVSKDVGHQNERNIRISSMSFKCIISLE